MPVLIDALGPKRDTWTFCRDSEPLRTESAQLISPTRWREERDEIRAANVNWGLVLPPDAVGEELADDLSVFALLAIEFPVFSDGRGYSLARLLRERLGYTGRLRAIGDLQADCVAFMARCGFDEFLLPSAELLDAAIRANRWISVGYQSDIRPRATVL
ncbi:MAG: DUF934 domain-containing protein [Pseudomonadota bacterium]